jgi:hypothetical protein
MEAKRVYRQPAEQEPISGCLLLEMKTAKAWIVVGAFAIASVPVVAVVKTEKTHFAAHGHYIEYGRHVDVDTVTPEPGDVPRLAEQGIVVPAEGQRATILNFTLLPGIVEACMSGIPVNPERIERRDEVTGKWIPFPPSTQKCLNLPIRSRVIWPLQWFRTLPVPLSKTRWFQAGNWVRIVAISKCDPSEAHREFASPPFQLAATERGRR